MSRTSLFVVEDDPELRQMLADYLTGQGVDVETMATAEDALGRLAERRPDLIVMDIVLPGMSGLEACRLLRRRGDTVGVILLTASADSIDRILGLELGADDYVNKPFSPRELLARSRAVLRRGQAARPAGAEVDVSIRIGEWRFVPASRSLHRGQEVRMLNTVEHALLAELTSQPNLPVARERLLTVSHTGRETALLRAVDAAIMRLRRLVESDPARPRYIQTVRFRGYMFVPHRVEAAVAES